MPNLNTAAASTPVCLDSLHVGARGHVQTVVDADDALALRLIEIGFVAGEPFEIIAESRPSGDPLAVRIGGTTFALRRREASAVLVNVTP